MLVITLGTQASGSTWLFNVVRALFEAAGKSVFASAADQATDALDQIPSDARDVVLKSHWMDPRLIRLATLADARIIVSTRDPLDSMVSQRERFASPGPLAAVDLSRSFATIASLPRELAQLVFRYEERFTRQESTVAQVAQFLGLRPSAREISRIFAAFEAAVVRRRVAAQGAAVDPATHFHPRHVGDGLIGKWRDRLDPLERDMAMGCLSPLAEEKCWQHQVVRWSGDLFRFPAHDIAPQVRLEWAGASGTLVYGPYLHLPPGRWRATPLLRAESRWRALRLKADVHLPDLGRGPLIERTGRVDRHGSDDLAMQFDHHDHSQPIEIRLAAPAGSRGRARFSGCELRWLAPVGSRQVVDGAGGRR